MTRKPTVSGAHTARILALLKRSRRPLTAYAILDKLRADGVTAPTTVYRALTALTQQGLAHRLESLNAYMACQEHTHSTAGDHHPHGGQFAICSTCQSVTELDLAAADTALQKVSAPLLAQVERQVVEITGQCHRCAALEHNHCASPG